MTSSSASTESSSDSGNTEKTPTFSLSLFKQKKKPSPSCSMKRPREEPRGEEASKPSSKKSKKPAQEDSKEKAVQEDRKEKSKKPAQEDSKGKAAQEDRKEKSKKPAQEDSKGKAAQDPVAEKSAKKTSGPIWNDKDEAAFANRLAAQCENGKHLPHNMTGVFEGAKKYLDGDYNHHQMYNKLRGLRKKFAATEDKLKEKSFDGFKTAHAKSLHEICKQVNWGNVKGKQKLELELEQEQQKEEKEKEKEKEKEEQQQQQQKEQEEGEGRDAARENLSPPLQDGTPDAMTHQHRMFDQHCKEVMGILSSHLRDFVDRFQSYIVNTSNTASATAIGFGSGFGFSIMKGLSSARELPSLSKTEAEMLDHKWQKQHLIEMEATSKRLALLQEEYQLRMAKVHH